MIYNFNTIKQTGKTYYETNNRWKYLKNRVKQLLDEKQSSREFKIDMIVTLLEEYKKVYIIGKGNLNNEK